MKYPVVAGSLALALMMPAVAPSARAQTLPSNVNATCTVSPGDFARWFDNKPITPDAVVMPADSVKFDDATDCNFYKWSEQMLLWLLSPSANGGHVFNSPLFYQVVPIENDPNRKLRMVQLGNGTDLHLSVRTAQVGPHGVPIAVRNGKVVSLVKDPSVVDRSGQRVTIGRGEMRAGQPVLFDKSNKPIAQAPGPLLLRHQQGAPIPIKRIDHDAKGNMIFFDMNNNEIDVDQGQAGSHKGVLMAQTGSLVYYTTEVNDVYAYFATGANSGAIKPANNFPTTQAELDRIVKFAGKTFSDGQALAIELKMSWVETTGIDAGQYFTIKAEVPEYTKSADNKVLTPTGKTHPATLALVGVHIVGSLANHPEMSWATFEHVGNTPLGTYSYYGHGYAGQIWTAPQSTAGIWLFSQSNAQAPFNLQTMNYKKPPNIEAQPGQVISPSNTLRDNAWGNMEDYSPDSLSNNTDILSLNINMQKMLSNGDTRKNYLLSGAIWTHRNHIPPDGEVGALKLANSTMETYEQDLNCFDCHQTTSPAQTGISHIFSNLLPLPGK